MRGIRIGVGLSRQPSSGFLPTDISNLVLWFDSSDSSTITEVLGDVSQWDDKSGQGNNVEQGTGSLQPRTGDDTINGKNVLTFDGGAVFDMIAGGLDIFNSAADVTSFFVFEPTTISGNTDLFRADTGASPYGSRYSASVLGSGLISLGGRRLDTDSFDFISTPGAEASINTPVLATFINDYTNADASIRVDGVVKNDQDAFSTSGTVSNTDSDEILIGSSNNTASSRSFIGNIAEIIMYSGSSPLTSSEIDQVESYLLAKWGI